VAFEREGRGDARRQAMSGIFLSYRRDDSSGWAGRLYEHLVAEWGPGQVFMDIDAIAPGEDFREAIARTMRTCDVVMVVIGPNWVGARDDAGDRRLDDQGDNHRAEVVAALKADVRVIPVLVGGAAMPKVSELPDALKDLAYRNAAVLEDRRFASDVRGLRDALRQFAADLARERSAEGEPAGTSDVGGSRQPEAPVQPGTPVQPDPGPSRRVTGRGADPSLTRTGVAGGVPVVLAVAGTALVFVWGVLVPRDWHSEQSGIRIAAAVVLVVGAVAGLWLRRWAWVVAAGGAGLVGLTIWWLQLVSTGHTGDDLLSPKTDGIPNMITFAGALLVLAGGLMGMRARTIPRG
jgi:hypothetical protein